MYSDRASKGEECQQGCGVAEDRSGGTRGMFVCLRAATDLKKWVADG